MQACILLQFMTPNRTYDLPSDEQADRSQLRAGALVLDHASYLEKMLVSSQCCVAISHVHLYQVELI
jgi:hypothetical protein